MLVGRVYLVDLRFYTFEVSDYIIDKFGGLCGFNGFIFYWIYIFIDLFIIIVEFIL